MTALLVAIGVLEAMLIAAVIVQWRHGRRIEAELIESKERIALATLPRNLGLWRWDARTEEVWATEHFREILQMPSGAPLSQLSVLKQIHPDDRTRFAAVLVQPGHGEIIASDFRVLRTSGELRWVAGKARATRDALGHVVRVTGVAIDITNYRQAEAERHSQHQQLAHLTRVGVMGELSGALAHELLQPLTAILSNAQAAQRFLASDHVDVSELRQILQDIVDDDRRAGEVIQSVRTLLQRGETRPEPFNVPQLVRGALAVMHSDLIERRVHVSCHFAEGLPAAHGDRVQIQQVLLNLVLNAAEALAPQEPRERRVEIGVVCDGGAIEITVADSGPGIAPERLERTFEAFYTTKKSGLGLGLAICRAIITSHGGRLWASSNGRSGATFHFTLPVAGTGTHVQ